MRVVDTETASAAIAILGFAIQRRLERGTSDDEIDDLVERFKRDAGLIFTVDTLEFLQKGGRIGKAAAFAGNLLHIKPILSIADGEVLPLKRVRGNQKAIQEFASAFTESSRDAPSLRVGIAHADAPERAQALRALVADLRPQAQIEVTTTLGAVSGRTPVREPSASSGSTIRNESAARDPPRRRRARVDPRLRGVRRDVRSREAERDAEAAGAALRLEAGPSPTACARRRRRARHGARLHLHRAEEGGRPGGADDPRRPRPGRLVPPARHPRRDGLPRAALPRQAGAHVVARRDGERHRQRALRHLRRLLPPHRRT